MAATKTERVKLLTPVFRVSFPNVLKPRKNDDGKITYNVMLVFDKGTDITEIKRAALALVISKYGKNAEGKPDVPKGFKWPFRDGSEKADLEGFEAGQTFFSASSTQPPGVIDQQKKPITEESEFYPGCYARATIHPFLYKNKSEGVSFGLDNLLKVREGKPLGRARAEEDFKDVTVPAEESAGVAAPELDNLDGMMG